MMKKPMKIIVEIKNNLLNFAINAAAPEGAPPRRINDEKFEKPPCPGVPRRGPEAGNPPK